MRTRITHIWMTPGVVAGDKKIPFIQDAEILIDGNRIVYAGKRDEAPTFRGGTGDRRQRRAGHARTV